MAALSEKKFWIFDMDGTLTVAAHDFNKIRSELGIGDGTPILEAISAMPQSQAIDATKKLHQLEMDIAAQSKPQPDAKTVLATLKKSGCEIGILTRNAKDIAQVTLEAAGLSAYFLPEHVLGRESCAPKPDPAGILRLISQWHGEAGFTAMVGDYVFDLQAGRNAQVTTVHLDHTGQFVWPQLTDHRITSLSALIET